MHWWTSSVFSACNVNHCSLDQIQHKVKIPFCLRLINKALLLKRSVVPRPPPKLVLHLPTTTITDTVLEAAKKNEVLAGVMFQSLLIYFANITEKIFKSYWNMQRNYFCKEIIFILSYLAPIEWLVMNKWYSIFYCHCNMVICPCKYIIKYDRTKKC